MAQETETSRETLKAATQKDALPANKLALVGTFDKAEGPTALIRMASGTIRMVAPGDRVGASTVLAIETGLLILTQGPHTRRLTLPKG